MAKCCVVFSQSPFEDLTAFRVRHVLLRVTRRDSVIDREARQTDACQYGKHGDTKINENKHNL